MKRFLFFSMVSVFLCLNVHAQNFENAGEYSDYINKQNDIIIKKFLAYNSAVSHGKRARKVEKLREKLLSEVDESRMNIGSMPKFKGDAAFRDSTVSFLKFYYHVLNDDYAKIVNMEDIAEQSYDEMEAYTMLKEQVDQKLREANERMKEAHVQFAAKNNMTLIDSKNKINEMMKQVGEVNRYYDKIYLIFFKPYIEETYLIKAIDKNNINGIEQNKTALLKYAQEGLVKLAEVKSFNSDNSVKDACKQMLEFYIKEVNNNMKIVTDFFLTKERFENIKKEYEKKSSHSNDDIAAFNKAVNEINSASDAYNNNNNTMNETRSASLKNWNKAGDSFFDEQMPKYK